VDQNKKQTLGILFQTLRRKRKQLGIPFRGTEIEANFRNSVPNHSAEEKTTQDKTRQRQSLTTFKLRVLVEALVEVEDAVATTAATAAPDTSAAAGADTAQGR
jgi:hypothetical protein